MPDQELLLESIQIGLSKSLGPLPKLKWAGDLTGGDINQAALLTDGSRRWFLKYHHRAPAGMFAAEARALEAIGETGCIRVPRPLAHGSADSTDWLALEHLQLTPRGSAASLGERLAALHRVNALEHGWAQDNYIGSTLQDNTPCDDWAVFWRDRRLKPQLEMACTKGHGNRLADIGDRLLENVPQLLSGHQPSASLLHGDLWSGNNAFTQNGKPVIFDPASYHGDRETDIAMTELFGGFGEGFYAAYAARYPLDEGYVQRRDLYNLYHVLNHLNLFGGGYLSRCESIIESLLSELS